MENRTVLVVKGAPYGNQNARGPHEMLDSVWGKKHSDWVSGLTKDQRHAFYDYDHASESINKMLRGQEPKEPALSQTVKHMMSALKPIHKDTYVYRFIHDFPHTKGEVYKDRGFVSTTANPKRYMTTFKISNKFSVLRIHVPKGVPVGYGSYDTEQNYPEKEILLPPWSHFRVVDTVGIYEGLPMSNLEYLPTKHGK